MQLDISDKLSFVLLAWTCAFLLPWEYSVPFVVLLIVLAFTFQPLKPVTPQSRKYFSRFLVYAAFFAVVLVVVNGLLIREGLIRFTFAAINLYDGGLEYGLTVSARLILISLSILVFFASIHFQDFAKYLESAGLPQPLISILLLTLFFLEQLPHRISQIFTAQEARGALVRAGIIARSRAFFLILSPLVLSSIVESVERGVALELRGYSKLQRTKHVRDLHARSIVWRYASLTISFIIIIVSFFHWLSK